MLPKQHPFRILALSLNDWSDQWTNRQHLLSRLAKNNTVLHSKGGWFSWDIQTRAWRQSPLTGKITQTTNVFLDCAPQYLVRFPRYPRIDRQALQFIARRWNKWLSRQGKGPRVLLIFHPDLFPYVQYIPRDILVYHAYDLFQHTPGWNEQRDTLETHLLQTADIATASSSIIAEALEKKTSRKVRVLPNGVDMHDFNREARDAGIVPTDLGAIAQPRLGYVGSLVFTVDFELVEALASRKPNWNFVFIGARAGKFDAISKAAFSKCQALPNIHFLGQKDVREVAAYSMNMDVNLMLYRISDGIWTQAGYPLKLHEYLAAGKPVVSSDLPSVRPFTNVVRIASGISDWLNAVEEAISSGGTGTIEERRATAAKNTWDVRVKTLQTWISEYLHRTPTTRGR